MRAERSYLPGAQAPYVITNAFALWDTSALPDNATIRSAYLEWTALEASSADGRAVSADWYLASPTRSCIANAGSCSSPNVAVTAGVSANPGVPIAEFVPQNAINYELSDPDVFVSRTARTGLRFHVTGGIPSGRNFVRLSGSTLPHLIVDYETPETQAVRATIRAVNPDSDSPEDGYNNITDAPGAIGDVEGPPDPAALEDQLSDQPAGVVDLASGGGYTFEGYRCPEVKGHPTLSNPTHIRYYFTDRRGCHIPLRTGNRDYGLRKQERRGREDEARPGVMENHHDVTQYARDRWQAALNSAGVAIVNTDPNFLYFSARYLTPGGQERTMCVLVHFAPVRDGFQNTYNRKGIISAWWARGLGYSEDCKRLDRTDSYQM